MASGWSNRAFRGQRRRGGAGRAGSFSEGDGYERHDRTQEMEVRHGRARGREEYRQQSSQRGMPRSRTQDAVEYAGAVYAPESTLVARRGQRSRGRGGRTPREGRGKYGRERVEEKAHINIRSLSLGDIMALRRLTGSKLISMLSNNAKAFQRTLEQDQKLSKPGIVGVLVEILLKVAQCFDLGDESTSQASMILAEVLSERCSNFHLQLQRHVFNLKGSSAGLQLARPRDSLPPSTQAQSLCKLFHALLVTLPNSSWSCLPVDELSEALTHMRMRGIVPDSLVTEAQDIVRLRDNIKETTIERKRAQHAEEQWDNREFRSEQILPRWEEICSSSPPARLRANIITGSYSDWNHYYDIHFRLLREDFIAPLRRGVCEYIEGARGRKLKDVKIYHNVVIIEPVCTRSGICYSLKFDVSRMQHCNWEHSKRLLFGSLLCLSPDAFQNIIFFAVVSNRDPEELKDGKLQVQIEDGKNILPYCQKASFTMVESLVYFEASKHILHSLQMAEVDTMPFTRYLIENQCSSVTSPKYLDGQACTDYDLHFLYNKESDSVPNDFNHSLVMHSITPFCGGLSPQSNESDEEDDILPAGGNHSPAFGSSHSTSFQNETLEVLTRTSMSSKGRINILDPLQWPHVSQVELDASQLQAIQMALTQEIALIQGPPGTGKTYIGLKIVEALLRNRKIWDPNGDSPILVMCLTNHALDQFLEGIIKNPNLNTQESEPETLQPQQCSPHKTKATIVRVGSRSRSEIVQEYLIDKKRKEVYVPQKFHRARIACEEWRTIQESRVLHTRSKYRVLSNSFVPLSEMRHCIHPGHLYQLLNMRTGLPFHEQEKNMLQIWLGLVQVFEVQLQPLHQSTDEKYPSRYKDEDQQVLVPHNIYKFPEKQYLASNAAEKVPIENKEDFLPSHSEDSEQDNVESSNDDVSDTELIDVEGEVSLEQDTRMLNDEADAFKALTIQQQDHEHHHFSCERFSEKFYPEQSQGYHEETYDTNFAQPQFVVEDVGDARDLFQWGMKQPRMTDREVQGIRDVNDLQLVNRWRLYKYWVTQFLIELDQQNVEEFEQYNRMCQKATEARQECDRFTLETANIIGMTTTGVAKNQHILHLVKPKIVIVEEAAEVLESHIVSALNSGTQHLILIGDHKQLRPKPNEYNLAKNYKLDVSLFERLIRNGFPRATLQIQHRMRPEIARLVHPHIYDTLINHESVLEYSNVRGVTHNLFFIQHSFPEKEDANLISHSNPHEAQYLAALCKHLLQQGYEPTQITILVTYTGQALNMRKEMPKKDFLGVKVTTVDNFQGEENDIILLSLVRSNPEENIGFLREDNRICVALSRAKMGFYCIGDFKMLRSKSLLWEAIISDMESKDYHGDALPLFCINHPDVKSSAKMPQDFSANAPEGGCTKDCDYRLSCGHVCVRKCHIKDPTHSEYECRKPCTKTCPVGHPCKLLCYTPCKPCKVTVQKEIPTCGHKQEMYCYEDPLSIKCTSPCPNTCPNGHACPEQCWKKICSPCVVKVSKIVPGCGHEQRMQCSVDPATFKCQANCKKKCTNGHSCPKRCFRNCGDCTVEVLKIISECNHKVKLPCHKQPIHANCHKPCEKMLSCGHYCPRTCGLPCETRMCCININVALECGHVKKVKCPDKDNPDALQCTRPCDRQLKCGHSCKMKCCEPCTKKCEVLVNKVWPCGHKLKRRCYQVLDPKLYPCMKWCDKWLSCGHKCTKRCSEECTKDCKVPMQRQCPRGHVSRMPCSADMRCYQRCDATLACGHPCVGRCYDCHISRVHASCKFNVQLQQFCGHLNITDCAGLQDSSSHPGSKQCRMKCPHKKCSHNCSQSCEPCMEPCLWQCPHHHCDKHCHEICDRPPCNERCSQKLKCGIHQCFGLCGEPCLEVCPICNRKQFRKKLKYAKQFSEKELYVQLDCGHIFTAEFMDRYVSSKPTIAAPVTPKQCPLAECGNPLIASFRYGTAAKTYMQNKSIINANKEDEHQGSFTDGEGAQLLARFGNRSRTRRRDTGIRSYKFLQSRMFKEVETALQEEIMEPDPNHLRQNLKTGPDKAFLIRLTVTLLELHASLALAPAAIESNFGIFEQFNHYLKRLEQEYKLCQLSQQLMEDFISEQYRLALMVQYSANQSTLTEADLTPTKELLDSLAKDSSMRLTKEDYLTHYELLERHTKSTGLHDYQLVHNTPVCHKVQWLTCSNRHIYSVPAAINSLQEQTCRDCATPAS